MHPEEDELSVERNVAMAARELGDEIDDRIKRSIREHVGLNLREALPLLALAAEVLAQAGSALAAMVRATQEMRIDAPERPTPPAAKPGAAKCRHVWGIGPPGPNGRPICAVCGKEKSANGRKEALATVDGVTKVDPPTLPLVGSAAAERYAEGNHGGSGVRR